MELLSEAKKYYDNGFSVIPVYANKKPKGLWKDAQGNRIPPNGNFNGVNLMGIVCGDASVHDGCGLEIIDIDTKYDLTGTLFKDYKKLINDNAPQLLKKLVVQQTQSGGYHFIYKCKVWDGNLKLANRPTTEDELNKDAHLKSKVLIETRGQGGYFVVAPSKSYKIIYGDIFKINEITEEERDILFSCAKTFNTIPELPVISKDYVKANSFETGKLSPFEDYNLRADIPKFLEENGWTLKRSFGELNHFLRPSGTGSWSGTWYSERRLFHVFSSSTEFPKVNESYNPAHILTYIKFNGNFSLASKWCYENGYGERRDKKLPESKIEVKTKKEISVSDYIVSKQEADKTVLSLRNGTYEKGLSTGIPTLDPYFLFKRAQFNIINGHDNVGKTSVLWYLAVLSAIKHDWKWIILSMENKGGGVKRKLMEFYVCKKITEMTDEEYEYASKFIDDHFTILKNNILWSYIDVMNITTELLKTKKYDSLLIDPYNGLVVENGINRHDWDIRATLELRKFAEDNDCCIWVNCHPATEAMRKKFPKDHKLQGYLMPPEKADTEGGTKFAGKADDFLTIHRHPSHPQDWMWTEIYVKKIRDIDSGGKYTMFELPVRIRMNHDRVGFEDANGYNPVLQKMTGHISINPQDIHTQEPTQLAEPIEPNHLQKEIEELPF